MQATTPWFTCKFDLCQNLSFWRRSTYKLCFQPMYNLAFPTSPVGKNFEIGDTIRIHVSTEPVKQGTGWQIVHWLRSCDGYRWIYILKHWYQAPEWVEKFVQKLLKGDANYANLWIKLEMRRKK